MHPPFFFSKEKRAVHGPKRKLPAAAAGSFPNQPGKHAHLLPGAPNIGSSINPPPHLRVIYKLWCSTDLTSGSFRAFRFAARCRAHNSGREIQRGGAAVPPLCVVRGCGGNRRSAAGGGYSEPVSRKRHDWRPQCGRESFCRDGVRNRNAPTFLFRGSGDILFSKENIPRFPAP